MFRGHSTEGCTCTRGATDCRGRQGVRTLPTHTPSCSSPQIPDHTRPPHVLCACSTFTRALRFSAALDGHARLKAEACTPESSLTPTLHIYRAVHRTSAVELPTAHSPFTPDSQSLWCCRRDVHTLDISCQAVYWQLAPPPRGQTANSLRGVAFTSSSFRQTVVPRSSLPERVATFQARKQASEENYSPQRSQRYAEGRQRIHNREEENGKKFGEEEGWGQERCGSRGGGSWRKNKKFSPEASPTV